MDHPQPTPNNNLDFTQSPASSFHIHQNPDDRSGPHLIECLKSDANSARWPSVGPVTDSKGVTCQWVVSANPVKSRWLSLLGRGIAEMLGLSRNSHKEEWKLQDFPSNYQLYTYIKGPREDQYLFGSTNVFKFRTANEFLPHLQWLAADGTICCRCKYCSGAKRQLEVNIALGLIQGSNHDSSSSKTKTDPNQSTDRAKRRRQHYSPPKHNKVYSNYEFQGPWLSENLTRDLLDNRSNFRKHELVWCLVTDLMTHSGQDQFPHQEHDSSIKFWPGLCEELILCSESRAFISIEDDQQNCTISSGKRTKRKLEAPRASLSKCFKNEFQTSQIYKWKIRLLGLSDIVIREEVQILPWLFKTVDLKQKFGMKKRPGMTLPSYVQNTHGSTLPELNSFNNSEERLVAFQLALQTAANLEEFWLAHDRYDSYPNFDTCEILPKMPYRTQLRGGDISSPVTIYFQGIWWGAEQIWLYDLVRLQDFKLDLGPALKPPGPENASLSTNKRGSYFLKIEGIYRDDGEERLVVMGKIFDLVQSIKNPKTVPSPSTCSTSTKPNDKQSLKRCKKWMPDPPTGYEFRQVTKPQEMTRLNVACISGRFYSPTRTNHSDKFAEISRRLATKVSQDDPKFNPSLSLSLNNLSYQYLSHEPPEQSFNDPRLVWNNASLFGLTPGQRNFMRCRKWRASRAQSIKEAERLAAEEMVPAYEKLKLLDGNQDIEVSHHDNPHHETLKSLITTTNNSLHHGHKIPKQKDQNQFVVIEIDP